MRKQIGMAVPRHGAKLIFEALLMTLAGIDYPSVTASVHEDDAVGDEFENSHRKMSIFLIDI